MVLYFSPLGFGVLDTSKFQDVHLEQKYSILHKIITTIGDFHSEIRNSNLDVAIENINLKRIFTLNRTKVFFDNDFALFIFENTRKDFSIHKDANGTIVDDRFLITSCEEFNVKYPSDLEVNNIIKDHPDILSFDSKISRKAKKIILKTIPFIETLEKAIVIPHIYGSSMSNSQEYKAKFIKKYQDNE